jgi:hypothetical protein
MNISSQLAKLFTNKIEALTVVFQKITQGVVGFFIILLITTRVSLENQGYFYALLNFSAAFSLLDLGLSVLMVQVSASFFSKSKMTFKDLKRKDLDNVFFDMLIWARRHFIKLSLLFLLFIPIGLIFFLNSASASSVQIVIKPFIFTIFIVALSIPALAIFSIIEGIGNIKEAYLLRIIANILAGFLAIFFIYYNQPLLAPAMIAFSSSLIAYYWAYKKYKNLFFIKEKLFRHKDIHWKSDLYALRGKVKITSAAIFLFQSGPTLIFFYFLSPIKAGQVGLSSSFLGMLSFICSAFFISNVPNMSKLVSSNKLLEFKKLFLYEFKRSFLLILIIYFVWIFLIYQIQGTNSAERFLPPLSMVLLTINFIVIHISGLLNSYSRCFGKEIMAYPFFISTLISILASILFHNFLGVFGTLLVMNISYVLLCFPVMIRNLYNIKYNS